LNRRGEDLLVYCDNEQGTVTKKSKQVCQYLGTWYHVKYNPQRHLFALGEQYLELHNTDVLLPTEENAIAFAQAYFKLEQTKEETSEESIEEELDINRHIQLTPIEPTENTQNMATQLQTAIAGTSGIQQAQQLPVNPINPAGQACLPVAPATVVAVMATPESIKDIFDRTFRRKGPGGPGGPPGGSGGPPGGPGGPTGNTGPPIPQNPIVQPQDARPMGSLPQIFDGSREKAQGFIEEVKGYL
jgi:hypothetical protein